MLALTVLGLLASGGFPVGNWHRSSHAAVVINEIHYHPSTDLEEEEFIEIYNTGPGDADLASWAFVDGVYFTFTTGTMLGPDEYLVLAKNPAVLAGLAPTARILGPWTGGLQNDGERVELANQAGTVVDQVRYNDAPPWPTTPDGRGSSLERISPTAPANDPANWTAAVDQIAQGWIHLTQTGTATSSRLYVYLDRPGEALLDDVSIVEDGFTNNLVYNGDFEGTFSPPWTAAGNHSASVRATDPDAHGGFYVCRMVSTGIGRSYTDSVNQYTQTLDTAGGTQYNLSLWYKAVSGGTGITARLSGGGLTVTYRPGLQQSSMTPGAVNSAYQANRPPFAESVAHAPKCPAPYSPVTVTATIRDGDGVASADLLYQTLTASNQSGITRAAMTRTSGTAQRGVWTGSIPAQVDRTMVRFRIEAADALGATRMNPDPTDARLTHSYFHYADDIQTMIPVCFMYDFGPMVSQDDLRGNVALVIRPPGATAPKWQVFDHIIRSGRVGGHNIFLLNHYEYDGMSGLNIIFESKPRYALAEYMTYEVHRAIGSLSEKVGHFRFYHNDQAQGYYLMFEQPNKTFIGRNGIDNDGNLYKIRYNAGPEKKTNLTLGNADIVELQNSVQSLRGAALTQYLFQNVAVDQLINYYVGNQLTSDWDGYFNNHYLYHDIEDTGVWYKIPWDRDKTWGDNDAYRNHPASGGGYLYPVYDMPILFGANGTPRSGLDSGTWWRNPGWLSGPFLADPVVQPRYFKRLEDATLRIFTVERWFPVIDALETRLEPEIPGAWLTEFHNDIESFRQQVIHRRAFILGAVNPLTYPNVTGVSPAPWAGLNQPPAEIVVNFTEPISTPTINASTFRLIRSGGDHVFGNANDVVITPASPPALVAWDEARLPLQGVALLSDTYRIELVGTGASPILDTVGNIFDGEFTGTLPSGDGAPGGDFHADFLLISTSAVARWEQY